jgi:hypothetical protein
MEYGDVRPSSPDSSRIGQISQSDTKIREFFDNRVELPTNSNA